MTTRRNILSLTIGAIAGALVKPFLRILPTSSGKYQGSITEQLTPHTATRIWNVSGIEDTTERTAEDTEIDRQVWTEADESLPENTPIQTLTIPFHGEYHVNHGMNLYRDGADVLCTLDGKDVTNCCLVANSERGFVYLIDPHRSFEQNDSTVVWFRYDGKVEITLTYRYIIGMHPREQANPLELNIDLKLLRA